MYNPSVRFPRRYAGGLGPRGHPAGTGQQKSLIPRRKKAAPAAAFFIKSVLQTAGEERPNTRPRSPCHHAAWQDHPYRGHPPACCRKHCHCASHHPGHPQNHHPGSHNGHHDGRRGRPCYPVAAYTLPERRLPEELPLSEENVSWNLSPFCLIQHRSLTRVPACLP